MKTLRIVVAALAVLAVAALAGIGRPEPAGGASDEPRRTITVTGVGRIDAAPDTAEFSVGVTTRASTARAALAANSERVRAVIAAIKAAGVAASDVTTHDVSVGRDYDGAGTAGYVATNSVSVRIRDLSRAGAVLDAATEAGANQIYGPALTREDRAAFEQRALERAVEHARDRARALAGAADVRLGGVTAITEAATDGVVFAERAALAADVPIEKGTQEIAATVTVTFAIE